MKPEHEEEVTRYPQVQIALLSSLLDFYGDRASGFASLFVASIFGLVTLSAIISAYKDGVATWYVIALIPYGAFALAGYYTWSRFRFWADVAHQIECIGIRFAYKKELDSIVLGKLEGYTSANLDMLSFLQYKLPKRIKIRFRHFRTNHSSIFALVDFFKKKSTKFEFNIRLQPKEKKSPLTDYISESASLQGKTIAKRILDFNSHAFAVLYFILILCPTVISFWNFFPLLLT